MTLEDYLKQNYSPTAVRSYVNLIKRYKLTLGETADQASHKLVLDYIGTLRQQQLHPKSLRNHLFAIKIYYNYLVKTGKRADHPCKHLYLKDQINRQIQVENLYTPQQLEQLYNTYQSKQSANQQRDKIIIGLLIYQALTVLEITQLKTQDINLEQATIQIKANHKNKQRELSLRPNQILLIHQYLTKDRKHFSHKQPPRKRTKHFILNTNGQPMWKGAINRIINKGKSKQQRLQPIKIRQSVISHLLKQNHNIRIVQEFAGHRRTASTEAYKQSGLEELKTVISKLHPLQDKQ